MNFNTNDISFDIRVGNKVLATFTMNPTEIVNIAEHNVAKNTCNTPAEIEQNKINTFNKIPPIDWHKVKKFVEENDIELNDVESGVLESYITKGTVSAKQERVLPHVLRKAQECGFKPSYLF